MQEWFQNFVLGWSQIGPGRLNIFLYKFLQFSKSVQGITQARWPGDDPFWTIPNVEGQRADFMRSGLKVKSLCDLVSRPQRDKRTLLESVGLSQIDLKKAEEFVNGLPNIQVGLALAGDEDDEKVQIPANFFDADMRKEVRILYQVHVVWIFKV